MARRDKSSWFDKSVPLPPGFGGVPAIKAAIEYVERELADLVEIYYEQANVFSALVGIFGAKALDQVSNWEKEPTHIHRTTEIPRSVPKGMLQPTASRRVFGEQSQQESLGNPVPL